MMSSFVLTVFVFISVCVLHAAAHRLLKSGKLSYRMINGLFPAGFAVIWILYAKGQILLPVSSFILYWILSACVLYFYTTMRLSGETPTSMILEGFKRRKSYSFEELVRLFSDDGLIWDRVRTLTRSGILRYGRSRYALTPRGNMIAAAIGVYARVFHRPLRG